MNIAELKEKKISELTKLAKKLKVDGAAGMRKQELMFALAQGIHQMTDQLAAINTIAASEQGLRTVEVTIGKLNGAADYAACLEYLQKLSLVTAVEILGADPGRVHFRLQLNAPSEHLFEAFDRGSVLLPSRAGSEYDYEFLR